jgi:protein associated with RNAse G/E
MIVGKDDPDPDCGNYRTWNKVALGLYMVDIIIGMNHLMQVKKSQREPWQMMAINYFFLLCNTSWFIVGNVWYYQNIDHCNPNLVTEKN